jgi:hypothetical protein
MVRLIKKFNSNELITEEDAIIRLRWLMDYIEYKLSNRSVELNTVFTANEEEKYLRRQLQKARRKYMSI